MTNQQQTKNSVLVSKLFVLCKYTSESANSNGGLLNLSFSAYTVYLADSQ